MTCMEFVNLMPYYLDNDISMKIKVEMDGHIKHCESCNEKLNKRKNLIASFKNVLEDEDVELKSRKKEIIQNIHSSRYSSNIKNKVSYHLNSHKPFYTLAVAVTILMVIVLKFGGNLYNPGTKYSYSKAMNKQNSTADVAKKDEPIVPAIVELQPTSTVIVKYDVLPSEKLNPTGDGISSIVNSTYRKSLTSLLKKMKTLSQGVGSWRTIYCNNDKLMFYNYGHLIVYNYNKKEKGIYSILDFSSLKVGSYQGSEIIVFSFSPDGNYCLIGTLSFEIDIKYNKDLYMYNVNDGTVKEIATNFSMRKDNVKWYASLIDSSKWIVSAKDDRETILWDVDKSKTLERLPTSIKEAQDNSGKFLNSDNLILKDNIGNMFKLDAERYIDNWWFKDDNTLIGVPYKQVPPLIGIGGLKLTDFEVVEINIKDKTGKIVFRP